MIRLTPGGPRIVKDDEWAALRQEFARRHCVTFEGFVDEDILERVPRMLEAGRFHTFEHTSKKGKVIAREVRLGRAERLPLMFFWLLNQPRLFDAIAEFTGCGVAIRRFDVRCYKKVPGSDHFHTWHTDCYWRDDDGLHWAGRLFGLTVNLSPEPCGGGFQIRRRKTREVLRTVTGTRFGDACLFRIHESLEHRALPVEGSAPRCICGGWFLGTGPDYRENVREMIRRATASESAATPPRTASPTDALR